MQWGVHVDNSTICPKNKSFSLRNARNPNKDDAIASVTHWGLIKVSKSLQTMFSNIFWKKLSMLIQISLKFVHKGPFDNMWAFAQTPCGLQAMAWTNSDRDCHYSDVIMSTMASQFTGVSVVYSTVCSSADKKTHQTPRHWPCEGNSPVNSAIPLTKAQ